MDCLNRSHQWAIFLFILLVCLLQSYKCQDSTSAQTNKVCYAWKQSNYTNFSYVVSITVNDDKHFCSGVLVDFDWVLTSYSCFQTIIDYINGFSQSAELLYLNSNPQCFNISVLQPQLAIQVSTVTDNCAWIQQKQTPQHLPKPLFGVVQQFNDFVELQVPQGVSEGSQKGNIGVTTNDFLLLKLDGSFLDVPLDGVKIERFNRDDNEIKYDILSWIVQPQNNYWRFGFVTVDPEYSNSYSCDKSFQEAICSVQNSSYGKQCLDDNFVCAEFDFPEISGNYYVLRSGDPLVRKQESVKAEIFGMFSNEFIPEELRQEIQTDFYGYGSGIYSLQQNGAVFVGFTESDVQWVQSTIDWYSDTRCIDGPKEQPQEPQSERLEGYVYAIIGIVVFVIVVVIVVVLVMCNRRPITEWLYGKPDQFRTIVPENGTYSESANISGRLGPGTIGDLHSSYNDRVPSGFIDSAIDLNLLSDLHLPPQVTEIPFNAFRNFKFIGAGNYGEVYSAEFKDERQANNFGHHVVAIKVVSKQFWGREQLEAILLEMKTMHEMNDDHVVRLLGASLQIRPAIVMEYVPYGTLKALLQQEEYKAANTTLEWKLKLMLNIARGVQYLHGKKCGHRDLKTDNLLVQDPGSADVKISDFGLARLKMGSTSFAGTKIGGTYSYMSPEALQFQKIDLIKADIWSLGVIMQEILNGKVPWCGCNEHFILGQIISQHHPPDQGALPEDCPQVLKQVIQRCWTVEPQQRLSADQIVCYLTLFLQEIQKRKDQPLQERENQPHKWFLFPFIRSRSRDMPANNVLDESTLENITIELSSNLEWRNSGKIGSENSTPSSSNESGLSKNQIQPES